jgi:hypothetical protein
MPLEFNRATKIAELPTADGRTITIQSVYDQFKDFEDEPRNMDLNRMVRAGGKDNLEGGSQTIVTCTLLDGWRLAFQAGGGPAQEIATVTAGNLVALLPNLTSQFPISQTAFVSGFIVQATTGALVEGSGITAANVWDYSGPYLAGSIGAYITKQLLSIAKFFQIVK